MPLLDSIPRNDWILRGIAGWSAITAVLIAVAANYAIVLLLTIVEHRRRWRAGVRLVWSDVWYHVIWCGAIPLGYGFLLPKGYGTARGRFTLPGRFFLLMCFLATWSGALFLANTGYCELHILSVVAQVKELSVQPTPADLLNGLRPVRNLFVWVLAAWSLLAVYVAGHVYVRRRAGVSPRFDWLTALNVTVLAAILVTVVVWPFFRFHEILARQQQRLYDTGRDSEASVYPTLPATQVDLLLAGPGLVALGFIVVVKVRAGDQALKRLPARPGGLGPDVFISYATADGGIAAAVVARLEDSEIGCWIAGRDIPGGTEWDDEIPEAIRASRLLVVILSSSAAGSDHVTREVRLAGGARIPILPVRIESVELAGALSYWVDGHQWVDVTPPQPSDEQLEHLAREARNLLSKGSSPRPGRVP